MVHYRPISSPRNDSQGPLDKSALSKLGLRAAVTCVTHPIEYAKVLIQIGHEPISPRQTKTIFGKPALALPSVFQYIGHIKKREGFLGLYSGLTPRLISLGLSTVVSDQVSKMLPKKLPILPLKAEFDPEEEDELNISAEEKFWRMIDRIIRESTERLAVLIVTQPFQVLAIRCMSQFIGGESKFNGILSGFGEILKENGIIGLWSGFIPRAIGEVATVVLTGVTTFALNNYVLEEDQIKKLTKHFASYVATSLCYPFVVVSNCMAVSSSGLAAGYPPCMPFYRSWTDCWSHLSKGKQLKRGSSLLFRYYTGPQVIVDGKVIPVNPKMFKSP